jgi:hypothetical protein
MGEKLKAAIQRWRQRQQHRKQRRRENPGHDIGARHERSRGTQNYGGRTTAGVGHGAPADIRGGPAHLRRPSLPVTLRAEARTRSSSARTLRFRPCHIRARTCLH